MCDFPMYPKVRIKSQICGLPSFKWTSDISLAQIWGTCWAQWAIPEE